MKLLLGCGYLGSRVARLWRQDGQQVAVVTRSPARAAELDTAGYTPIIADVTDATSLGVISNLSGIDTMLYAVGFDRASNKSMREIYVGGLRAALDALPQTIERLIYISTTGVYAQNDGSWIDEDSPCEPTREAGRVCLEAEDTLRAHALATRAIILRLAGIYGPSRIPRRDELLAGKPVTSAPDGYLNLIHVEDAARIILAVEQQARPPRTYLVSDGHPVLRREYYDEAARLLGAPRPIFAPPEPADLAQRRGNTDKRVNNARVMNELTFQLAYPTYKLGLAAIIAAENPH